MNKTTEKEKQGQTNSGFYSILSLPFVFNTYQYFIGADSFLKRYVNDFVCPFPGAKILDIGCGTATILSYLPETVKYTGYDSNPQYINYAIEKFKSRGTFYCQDVNNSTINDHNCFDIVLACAILHHIDDNEAKMLFATARNILKPHGYIVTYDGTYIEQQSKIAKFILSRDRGQYVRTPEEYTLLAKESFSEVKTFIIHDMYKIPYTGIIMKCYKE